MVLFVSDPQLQKILSDNKDLGLIQWMSVLYVLHLTNKGSDEQAKSKTLYYMNFKKNPKKN